MCSITAIPVMFSTPAQSTPSLLKELYHQWRVQEFAKGGGRKSESIFFAFQFFKGSGSGSYSGGLTWSIVLRCDDHTGIFTCDGCARDPYFYVPAETQSYVIKLSCSRKVLAASGD